MTQTESKIFNSSKKKKNHDRLSSSRKKPELLRRLNPLGLVIT